MQKLKKKQNEKTRSVKYANKSAQLFNVSESNKPKERKSVDVGEVEHPALLFGSSIKSVSKLQQNLLFDVNLPTVSQLVLKKETSSRRQRACSGKPESFNSAIVENLQQDGSKEY